jgi:hypothetical protein
MSFSLNQLVPCRAERPLDGVRCRVDPPRKGGHHRLQRADLEVRSQVAFERFRGHPQVVGRVDPHVSSTVRYFNLGAWVVVVDGGDDLIDLIA